MDGVLPLEVTIDTKKKEGIFNLNNLERIERFQKETEKIPEISKPLSVVEVVKFAKQAFYNGNPEMYKLPNNNDKAFIFSYLPSDIKKNSDNALLKTFIDTNYQVARVSMRLKNIYTPEIKAISDTLENKLNEIFPKTKYKQQ